MTEESSAPLPAPALGEVDRALSRETKGASSGRRRAPFQAFGRTSSSGGREALRNAGFVACLVGALTMITGRFVAGAPVWLVYVGVGVIALGWGLFGYSILLRAERARASKVNS